MSHSQFHSTNLFILRHAWLNLWDKHMTTGRINQVTTFQITHKWAKSWYWQPFGCFPNREFINRLCFVLDRNRRTCLQPHGVLACSTSTKIGPPCHQVSHVSDTTSPCLLTKIVLLFEDYQQPESPWERCTQSRRISEWLYEDRFSYQQVIHTLRTSQTSIRIETKSLTWTEPSRSASISSKLVLSWWSGVSTTRSEKSQPSHSWSVLDKL